MNEFKILEMFPGYKIYKNGDIVSTKRKDEKVLRGKYDKDGYREYHLRDKFGQSKYVRGHRLVASAWVDNPDNLDIINHKDGNRAKNHADNLEWCTVQYNTQYSFDNHGRQGHNGGMNQKVSLHDLDWNFIKEFNSFRELANHLGFKSGSAFVTSYFTRVKKLGDGATINGKYRAKRI